MFGNINKTVSVIKEEPLIAEEDESLFSDESPLLKNWRTFNIYQSSNLNLMMGEESEKKGRSNSYIMWKRDKSKQSKPANFLFKELFEEATERIWKESPFGKLKTWKIMKFIVKTNDDLR